MSTTLPVRSKEQVRALTEYYYQRGELRNYLLVVMSIHSGLRISDLLHLKWTDVYDAEADCVRNNVVLVEQKTKKSKWIALNKKIRTALEHCLHLARYSEYLFASRKGGAIGRVQAYRIIRAAAEALNFSQKVSCHSLRKTFGYLAWKAGISPVVIMEIYNHSSFIVTRRYLGLTHDETDEAYHRMAEVV